MIAGMPQKFVTDEFFGLAFFLQSERFMFMPAPKADFNVHPRLGNPSFLLRINEGNERRSARTTCGGINLRCEKRYAESV
jgi:hypothetical protein